MSNSAHSKLPEVRLRVGVGNRITIPAAYRRALGVKAGDILFVNWKDDELRATTMKLRIEQAQRHARRYLKPGVSLVDELIADRRREAKRELE